MKKISTILLLSLFSLAHSETASSDNSERIILTLETAIPRALNYNRHLLDVTENKYQTEFKVDVANSIFDWKIQPNANLGYVGGGDAGAGMACGVGIDFRKRLECGTIIDLMPSFEKISKTYQTNARTRVTTPLLRGWGREYTLAGVLGAQFGLRTITRRVYITQCQLVMRTITALYEIVKTYKAVLLNEASYKRVSKFYQAAKLKAQIGLADPLDIYRAETEMRHAEDAFTTSKERFQEVEDNLRDLLALPPDATLVVNVPLIHTPIQMNLEEAIETALKNRIEIDQALDQTADNRRLSRIAKERLWPELNMVLNYSNCGLDQVFTECLTSKRESKWGIGFTTSTDFNPIAERAAYEQSLLDIGAAQRNEDQVKADIIFEVKRVMRQLNRSIEKIALQEKQIHTANGEWRLAQIKFDRGMANNFDLIQAEKALRSSELNYWNAIVEHIISEYHILHVIGLLLDKPL